MQEKDLNEQVARKLGTWINRGKAYDPTPWTDGTCYREYPPDYCGSIQAAWEIVESLTEDYFSLAKCIEVFEGHRWECRLGSVSLLSNKFVVYAETAPLAIVKAFLQLSSEESSLEGRPLGRLE